MDERIAEAVEALRGAGWQIDIAPAPRTLPREVAGRHREIPPPARAFITSLDRCERGDVGGLRGERGCRLFTARDYAARGAGSWRWDRFERIFTDSSPPVEGLPGRPPDAREAAAARRFWDAHLPILHYGVGELEYLAIVTDRASPRYGEVVHGFVIDYDEPRTIAPGFEAFLGQLRDVARAPPTASLFRENYLAWFVHARLEDDGAGPAGDGEGIRARIAGWLLKRWRRE